MDFGSVLYKAQKNKVDSKQAVSYYKSSFDPPKKEQREKKLSVNIQKFLARQEDDKKQKLLEEERKKQELFALRNKDKKSNKRIQSMLKRTKSANKSVLEDAEDHVNTAITAAGPLQPDEDDYGYVSKDASDLYDKLLNRYANESLQEKPVFSHSTTKSSADILSTKDRVKAALQREEDEKLLPRKRKRKSKNEDDDDCDKELEDKATRETVKSEKYSSNASAASAASKKEKIHVPKKNTGPPPIDFQSLLKLAEQKQHEPIVIEKKVDARPDRPMTEKEKQEFLREKARTLRRDDPEAAAKLMEKLKKKQEADPKYRSMYKEKLKTNDKLNASATPISVTSKNNNSVVESNFKGQPDDRTIKSTTKPVMKLKSDSKSTSLSSERIGSSNEINSVCKPFLAKPVSSKEILPSTGKHKFAVPESKMTLPQTSDSLSKEQKQRLLEGKSSSTMSTKVTKSSINGGSSVKSVKVVERNGDIPLQPPKKGDSICSSKPQPMIRQFPPPDVRRSEPKKEFNSSKPQYSRQFPPSDMMLNKKKPVFKRRQVIESDDEYDSDLDGFIDDSEADFDVSREISQIFGYDRSKFSRYDDDDEDECMESNFSQLQKEEFMSTKYGILEDLADIRKTKLEKERKKKRFK